MGQKVNPVGMRIGISRDWNSKWFAEGKDFAKNLNEDYKIRTYLSKELKRDLVSHIEIERSKNVATVSVFTARPGQVLGAEGARIKELTKALVKLVKERTNDCPILVLDDVFSELDEIRKKEIYEIIKDFDQVFITGCNEEDIKGFNSYISYEINSKGISKGEKV